MSAITKQLLINSIPLPDEILTLVKDCIFTKVRKIPKNDPRYSILKTIPKTCLGYNLVGVCLQKQGSNVGYLLYYSLNTTLITMYKRNDYYTNGFNTINIFHQI
jgi:hypothetical protein